MIKQIQVMAATASSRALAAGDAARNMDSGVTLGDIGRAAIHSEQSRSFGTVDGR